MDKQVAVYIDYENIYWSMKRQYNYVPDPGRLIETIRQLGERHGNVCLMQAYADFDNEEFHGLLSELQRRSVEPRHVFSKNYDDGTRKNAADIEMSLDALELMYNRDDIEVFLLVCGDRDMIQVARKLRNRGKSVYVAAVEKAMSKDLIAFANGFETMENLMGVQPAPPATAETVIRRLEGLETAMPFVGLKYFMKLLSGGEHSDPRVYELVNRCIAQGIVNTFPVPNPYDERFPTTACRLNHQHPQVREVLGRAAAEARASEADLAAAPPVTGAQTEPVPAVTATAAGGVPAAPSPVAPASAAGLAGQAPAAAGSAIAAATPIPVLSPPFYMTPVDTRSGVKTGS